MDNCVFCRIVRGEIPAEVVYEDEQILAFKDIYPLATVHVLLIPKKHIPDLTALTSGDVELVGQLHLVANQVAKQMGIDRSGYRLASNCRADAGQEVFHLHYHLLGGQKLSPMG